MTSQTSVVIAGAGIFGLSAALELRARGYAVTVVDPGPVPHPLAASNDVSRMVRMDYADDKLYSDLAAEAIEGWHLWNRRRGRPLYHEDGFLVLTSHPLESPAVERQSLRPAHRRRVASGAAGLQFHSRALSAVERGALHRRVLQPSRGLGRSGRDGIVHGR